MEFMHLTHMPGQSPQAIQIFVDLFIQHRLENKIQTRGTAVFASTNVSSNEQICCLLLVLHPSTHHILCYVKDKKQSYCSLGLVLFQIYYHKDQHTNCSSTTVMEHRNLRSCFPCTALNPSIQVSSGCPSQRTHPNTAETYEVKFKCTQHSTRVHLHQVHLTNNTARNCTKILQI